MPRTPTEAHRFDRLNETGDPSGGQRQQLKHVERSRGLVCRAARDQSSERGEFIKLHDKTGKLLRQLL